MTDRSIHIYCTDREGLRYNISYYKEHANWQENFEDLLEGGHTVTIKITEGKKIIERVSHRLVC